MFSLIDESEEGDKISYISILFELLQNRVRYKYINKCIIQVYVFTMLGICCLLFIVTGIQFWISDYMQTVLHIDPKKVFISFAVVSITAPVLGVIAGGYLIQKLGGYTNKTALIACFKISVLAALSGMFLSIIDNFPLFIILMWLLLFFGASIVPGLTGIMLSSTPEKTKEIANSITHLCYNLLGYLPSPFLYGLVCKYTGGPTSRYGLAFILLFSYFGVFFLYLAKYYKTKPHEKKPSKESPFELNVSTTPSKESTHDTSDYSNAYKMEVKAVTLTALYGRLSI